MLVIVAMLSPILVGALALLMEYVEAHALQPVPKLRAPRLVPSSPALEGPPAPPLTLPTPQAPAAADERASA